MIILVFYLCRTAFDIVYHIYICDIDKPWATHKLISVGEQVVALEWHDSGLQLLVATSLGTVSIYKMKVCQSTNHFDSAEYWIFSFRPPML